jgi:ectoine hydroxylase-related dioxygenase (phytanoyl-CoA dioxygenase family)
LHSPAHEIAAKVMESNNVQFFYDQLLVKEPGTSQRTPWHTDADYFPIKGDKITSIWLPLERITRENGGLQFIKGSHRMNISNMMDQVPKKNSRDQNKGKYVLPDFDDYPDKFEFLSFDMEPGDCLVFHIGMVHMGHDNISNIRRRALSTRWFGEGCTINEDKPHILNTLEIAEFIESQGFTWDRSLNNPLFPKFSI